RPLHLTPQCLPRPRLSSPLSSCRDAPPRPLHSFPTRRSSDLYGGVDMKAQIAELKEGREIIVATPGRLLDHVQQKTVNFNQVERSEEHTSELQSRENRVCRRLLEKKKEQRGTAAERHRSGDRR